MEKIEYNLTQPKQSNGITRWHKIGQARKSDDNFWVRLDVQPIPNQDGEIWLNLFERNDDAISEKNAEKQEQKTVHKNGNESQR